MKRNGVKYLRGNMLFVLVVLAVVLGISLPMPETPTVVKAQEEAKQIQTGDSLERRYYFTTIIGEGTYKNPYRSKVTDFTNDWGMIDLRPDPTVQEGYAFAYADTTLQITGDPEIIPIVDDLTDTLLSSKSTFLNYMLDTGIEAGDFPDFVAKLLIGKQKPNLCKPLRPSTDGEYRIFLGGQIYGKPKPTYKQGTIADNFTGGSQLTWAEPVGDFNFVNNQAESVDAGENIAYANEAEPTSDAHYSQCTREAEDEGASSAGVAVRVEVGGQTDCYMFLADTDTPIWQLYERFNGDYTLLTSGGTPAASSGQVLYLEQDSGDNLVAKEDGDTKLTVTDSTITGNTHAGIRAWNADKDLDNFEAADLAAVSAPTVVTNAATSVEETTATLSGNITATGGENANLRGFYWDTDNATPWSENWTESGNFTVGNFTHGLTSLTKGEWYQYIASANNSGGSANGTVEYFLTKPDPPNTLTVTDQGSTWITISWVKGTGTDNTTVNYRTDQTPTDPDDGTASYNGTGTTDNITGLSAGQIYYIGAWSQCWEGGLSQNSDGSDNLTDYTLPGDPSNLTTDNVTATSIEMTWAKGTGGDYTEIRRKAGSYPANVADGTQSYYNTGTSDNDTGLDKGTTYFYRAWARDTDSNYYSAGYTQSSNTTSTTAPTVTNNGGATNITDNASRLRGEITDTGGDNPTTYVYWGLTDGSENVTAWANEENLGVQTANFYFDSSNLTASTMYFYRCKAINEQGTDWANSTANFTTLSEGFAIGAPTNITITDHGAITVEFNWTKGVDSTYTMIRAGRTEYPVSTTEGELIYYGDNTTCNMTGFSLLTTNYKFTLWGFHSDNSTSSSNVTTGNIGGEDMEAVADEIGALATALGTFSAFTSGTVTQVFTLFLCVAITGLAFWRNNVFLYLLAAPVDLVYGLSFAAGSTPGSDAWVEGVIVAIIGTFCLFKVVVEQFMAQVSRKRGRE